MEKSYINHQGATSTAMNAFKTHFYNLKHAKREGSYMLYGPFMIIYDYRVPTSLISIQQIQEQLLKSQNYKHDQ